MTVPSGVAVMAAAHQTWPVAVTVGGACGVLACIAQAHRWRAPLLVPAAEAAGVLGLAGVAALTGMPLGIGVAAIALVAVVARRDAPAGRLAGVAVAVPLLAVLGALGVGPGTALRLGAGGDVLRWAAPAAGAVAAIVYAVLARRRREVVLAGLAVVASATGAATGLALLRPVATVWFGAVGALLLGVLAVTELPRLRRDGYWSPWAARTARAIGLAASATGALVAWPLLWWLVTPVADVTFGWATAVWAVLAAVVARRAVVTPPVPVTVPVAGARLAAAALGLFAVAEGTGAPRAVLVAVAVVVALGVLVRATVVEQVAVTVVTTAVAVTVRTDESVGWGVAAAGVLAVAALVAVLVARRAGPLRTAPVAALATAATVAGAVVWPSIAWSPTFGLALAGLLVVAAGRRGPGVALGLFAAAAATVAGAGVSTATAVGWLLATVVLTGVMVAVDSSPELEAAAITATVVATAFALGQPAAGLVSVAGMAVGGQLALGGVRRRRAEYTSLGALVAAGALVTLPVTSGALAWMLGALAPHGITGTDVAVAGLALGLVAGGMWFRRRQGVNSWIAYGPVLAVAGTHLLTTQAATGQVGRVAMAVGVGVVAVAAGGLRRLASPLLGGTALVTASVVLASGHQLASLPVWVWLAVGGLGLLTVAGLIEWRAPADDGTAGQPTLWRLWRRLS